MRRLEVFFVASLNKHTWRHMWRSWDVTVIIRCSSVALKSENFYIGIDFIYFNMINLLLTWYENRGAMPHICSVTSFFCRTLSFAE